MPALRCTAAGTPHEIADAQRVRWTVYGEEERLVAPAACLDGREVDARDADGGTVHLLVYAGDEAVGTVRLLLGRTGGGRLGLDLESKFDLRAFARPGIVAAEVTRYCVVRRFRCTGVAKLLYTALGAESRKRGVTHWVAAANMETDCAEDAALAYRLIRARNLVDDRFRVEPRAPAPASTPRRRPCYTDEQRRSARCHGGGDAGLPLPRTIALFATRMGARYIGPPAYDGYFNVFALPLVASLA